MASHTAGVLVGRFFRVFTSKTAKPPHRRFRVKQSVPKLVGLVPLADLESGLLPKVDRHRNSFSVFQGSDGASTDLDFRECSGRILHHRFAAPGIEAVHFIVFGY